MRTVRLLLPVLVLLAAATWAQTLRTIPEGATIKVRTDTAIPAKPAANTRYMGTIAESVTDANGAVIIPRASRAQLRAIPTADGKDTTLDLRSVNVNGRTYLLQAAGTSNSSTGGLGANTRTAKYVGGGAVVGTLLGAVLGGGKGAAIGALVGGAGGAGAQVLTGRKKEIPAETELSYKLAQSLEMRPSVTVARPAASARANP